MTSGKPFLKKSDLGLEGYPDLTFVGSSMDFPRT